MQAGERGVAHLLQNVGEAVGEPSRWSGSRYPAHKCFNSRVK